MDEQSGESEDQEVMGEGISEYSEVLELKGLDLIVGNVHYWRPCTEHKKASRIYETDVLVTFSACACTHIHTNTRILFNQPSVPEFQSD